MSWHGPTPMIARDGQWVPSPFAPPAPPPTPAPPPFPAAPPTPTFSQPLNYSQTAPNYTSHSDRLVRNIEVGAAVWSAYELPRIRLAQQQSLAYQRESLRMQRAQTMLMAGWSWSASKRSLPGRTRRKRPRLRPPRVGTTGLTESSSAPSACRSACGAGG